MKAHRSSTTRSHVKTPSHVKLSTAVACLVFTAAAIPLLAAEQPKLPPGVTCEVVREKVALHGVLVAYAWAKQNGYSDKHIAQANRCLRS
jgi:hypothetical protein